MHLYRLCGLALRVSIDCDDEPCATLRIVLLVMCVRTCGYVQFMYASMDFVNQLRVQVQNLLTRYMR